MMKYLIFLAAMMWEAEAIHCEDLRPEIQSSIIKLDAKTLASKSTARIQSRSNVSQLSPSKPALQSNISYGATLF